MNFRIGQGFDLHRTQTGRPLFLGGISIPNDFGLQGHSDADVLLHAIIDALLGALACGDIGQWFPDTDDKWLDADSKILLKTVLQDERIRKWKLVNLDCTVFAERPKLAPWRDKIRESLRQIFDCRLDQISVKAKTAEKCGEIGRQEAIAAAAILLLEDNSNLETRP